MVLMSAIVKLCLTINGSGGGLSVDCQDGGLSMDCQENTKNSRVFIKEFFQQKQCLLNMLN